MQKIQKVISYKQVPNNYQYIEKENVFQAPSHKTTIKLITKISLNENLINNIRKLKKKKLMGDFKFKITSKNPFAL